MFNPQSNPDEPTLPAPRKKKFRKPSGVPIDKLTPAQLDIMLLQDYWDFCVDRFPTPPTPLVRSWLQRCGFNVDLCIAAIENVARNLSRSPLRFASAEHAYMNASGFINRANEARKAEGQAA